jgi:hypothetical protein
MAEGIFIVADLFGPEADRIAELQRELDPKFAGLFRPHVTLTGSSGAGVLPADLDIARLESAMAQVAEQTVPFNFVFGPPERFPATNIIALPLPVNGPVRWLHDGLIRSGLPFGVPKFAFTPHCTVHFFRTFTTETWERAKRFRVHAPIRVERVQAYLAQEFEQPRLVCEVGLCGG